MLLMEWPRLLAAAYLCLVVAAMVVWIRRDRRLDTIPGPKQSFLSTWTAFGLPPNAPQLFRNWAEEYGELFKVQVGWHTWVVINSPQAVKDVLDRQSAWTSSKIPAPIGDGIVADGRRMINMPYGPRWRTYRSLVHQLLSPKMTQLFVPAQSFEIKQLLWDLATNNTSELEFYRHVQRMSYSIIMTATYGRRVERWENEDAQRALESSKVLGKISKPGMFLEDEIPVLAQLPSWLQPSRKLALQYAKPVNGAKLRLWDILKQQMSQGAAPACFAHNLMLSDYQGRGLTDSDAAWIAGGLVEAGSETSSVTLNNLILHLAAYPSVQALASQEISNVVGDDRAPEYGDIDNLPYIRACIKEILRLRPVPTWGMKHYTDADITYKSFVIPKGTVVLGNTAAIHFDSSRYESPFLFHPDRYLKHSKTAAEYAAMADPYERDHFTFGVGRRICPGSRLAENTLHLALANILWAFEIRPPTTMNGKDAEIDLSDSAFEPSAFRPPKAFKARFVPRSETRSEVLRRNWEIAEQEGYALNGVHFNGCNVGFKTQSARV